MVVGEGGVRRVYRFWIGIDHVELGLANAFMCQTCGCWVLGVLDCFRVSPRAWNTIEKVKSTYRHLATADWVLPTRENSCTYLGSRSLQTELTGGR